jgi:hypothetical protein
MTISLFFRHVPFSGSRPGSAVRERQGAMAGRPSEPSESSDASRFTVGEEPFALSDDCRSDCIDRPNQPSADSAEDPLSDGRPSEGTSRPHRPSAEYSREIESLNGTDGSDGPASGSQEGDL